LKIPSSTNDPYGTPVTPSAKVRAVLVPVCQVTFIALTRAALTPRSTIAITDIYVAILLQFIALTSHVIDR